ncbi:hypothetical protein GGI05_001840 [Coemansia sp. RSA 2603]|nr:hypothetical protein GGI05_001840 [Coemansia sp. RSA 2603]
MGFFRKSSSKTQTRSEPAPTPQRYLDAGLQAGAAGTAATPLSRPPPLQSQQTFEYQPYVDPDAEYVNIDGDGAVYEQSRSYNKPSHNHHHAVGLSTLRMKGAYDRDDDDADFDDAASYHSISSNPGMARPKTANSSAPVSSSHHNPYRNDGGYAQTMPSRYMQMATHGRGAARANNPGIDSYYSTAGDEVNIFRSAAGQRPEFASYSNHSQERTSYSDHYLQTPSQPHSQKTSPAMHQHQSQYHQQQQYRQNRNEETERPKTDQELGEEYFQRAVNYHEQGDLASATGYFKRAADKYNPLGMLFYGLSLRHGWGCQPNENLAFVFLQKAGEHVVPHVKDMDPAVAGMAKDELAMAIYELGQSYRHGWGVSRNKKTAAYYFEVAAELGDADAQGDIAACYEKGDGVKRDMKKAAHYYRLAHKQGVQMFGTSWIFKKKYDSD